MGDPIVCETCGKMSFQNAATVVVLLQPVDDGLLLTTRGIEPFIGTLALLSGYQELEDWRVALAREAKEEIGLDIDPEEIRLYALLTTPDGKINLVFGLAPPIAATQLADLTMSTEVPAVTICRAGDYSNHLTAFSLHNDIIKEYFFKL